MIVLAISTSSNICSVALLNENKCIKELNITDTKTHSENLMPLIDRVFKETGLTLNDINLLACDIGPGSFTGIRIGISTIKAFAEFKNIPIIPVSSLEALAYNVKTKKNICSLIDARNNQVYCGVFNKNFEDMYFALDINETLDSIKNYVDANTTFVGNAAVLHKNLIQNYFGKIINFSETNEQSSISTALAGLEIFKLGNYECRLNSSILFKKISSRKDERNK